MKTSVVFVTASVINTCILFGNCHFQGRQNVDILHQNSVRKNPLSSKSKSAVQSENLRSGSINPRVAHAISAQTPTNYVDLTPPLSSYPAVDRTNFDFLEAYTVPNISPVKHSNIGGLFSVFMNGSEDDFDDALAQNAVLDTIADILSVIGLKDLRDWLGIITGLVILGPVFVIILLIPAPILILGALIVPLIWYNPPSKINNGVVGHDGTATEATVGRYFNVDTPMFKAVNNGSGDSNCVEMLACELRGVVRRITSSGPVSRAPAYDGECAEYYCSVLHPLQTFLASYYFYIFGDGKQTVL